MATDEKCFAFMLNTVKVLSPLPVEIIPHHFLRRPETSEIEKIREGLQRFGGMFDLTILFESRTVRGKQSALSRRSNDPQDWHYYVIGLSNKSESTLNAGFIEIERAARLTNFELRCGFIVSPNGGFIYSGILGEAKFEKLPLMPPQSVTAEQLAEIGKTVKSIEEASRNQPRLFEIIDSYWRLRSVPANHVLYTLGLFTVIESILTHNPHGGYDSLGHQIKSKMRLLNNRFFQPLDWSGFAQKDSDKIWSALYEYRSRIAHGGTLEFRGKLAILKDRDTALSFLECATKTLLRHSLEEPQLLEDLQKC
jgi:hypothetical protein